MITHKGIFLPNWRYGMALLLLQAAKWKYRPPTERLEMADWITATATVVMAVVALVALLSDR